METDVSLLLVAVVGAVLCGSLAVWAGILSRWSRGAAALPADSTHDVPWNAGHVLAILGIYLVSQLALGGALYQFIPESPENRTASDVQLLLIGASLANLLVVAFGIGLLVTQSRATSADLGLPREARGMPQAVGLALFGFLAAATPVYLLQTMLTLWVEYKHPVVEMVFQRGGPAVWVAAIASAVVAAPIFEEFCFRLVLQGWLEKALRPRTGIAGDAPSPLADDAGADAAPAAVESMPLESNPYRAPHAESTSAAAHNMAWETARGWAPIVISSLLFALLHLGQGPAPIPLFILALVLGYIYRQTHQILPCIFMHALFNAFSLLVLWISLSAA